MPRVHRFVIRARDVVYDGDVSLISTKRPFHDLLSVRFMDSAPIATNGVYLSVILKSPDDMICRIFRLRDGLHLHDVPIGRYDVIGWTFDIHRPGHTLLIGRVLLAIDSICTLPTWMLGFQGSGSGFSFAFSVTAMSVAGTTQHVPFSVTTDDLMASPIEKAIRQLVHNHDTAAAHGFLVFLPMLLRRGPQINIPLLFTLFEDCHSRAEFASLRMHVNYVFLASLDVFALEDHRRASALLGSVLESSELPSFLFGHLARARFLVTVLTVPLIQHLCEVAFRAEPVYQHDSVRLLKRIQFFLIEDSSPLLFVCLRILIVQFGSDCLRIQTDDDWEKVIDSSVSVRVFSDLLLQLEANLKKIVLSFEIIDLLFCVSEALVKGNVLQLKKLGLKSLMLGFRLAFKLIEKDQRFYTSENVLPTREVELDVDWVGIPEDLKSLLIRIVTESYVSGLDISRNIQIIVNSIRAGRIGCDDFQRKCGQVLHYSPQPMETVLSFLLADRGLEVVDAKFSPAFRLIRGLLKMNFRETPVFQATFSSFLSELKRLCGHFLQLPRQSLLELASCFSSPAYLPPEVLRAARISISNLSQMDDEALVEYLPTLLKVPDLIERFELESNRFRLLRTVVLALITFACRFPMRLDCDDLILHCLRSGDYKVIRHAMLLLSSGFFNQENCVKICLEFVSQFISGRRNLFVGQTSSQMCYCLCHLISDYCRLIFNENRILLFRFLRNEFRPALFMIFSSDIDVLRPGVIAHTRNRHGKEYSGSVVALDRDSIFVAGQIISVEFVTKLSSEFSFSVDSSEGFDAIRSFVLKFETDNSLIRAFQFSAVRHFKENLDCEYNDNFSFKPLTELICELGDSFHYHFSELPLICFTEGDHLYNETILSFDSILQFVSSPIHPSSYSRLSMKVTSRNDLEPPLTFSVYQIGHSPGCCFKSIDQLVVSEAQSAQLEIIPEKNLIFLTLLGRHDFSVYLEPCCDLVFLIANLGSTTIVDFVLDTDPKHKSDLPEEIQATIPTVPAKLPAVPSAMSSQFLRSHVKELCNQIAAKFQFEISLTSPNLRTILLVLLAENSNPFSTNFSLTNRPAKSFLKSQDPAAVMGGLIETLNEQRAEVPIGSRSRSASIYHGEVPDAKKRNHYIFEHKGDPRVQLFHVIPEVDPCHTVIEYLVNLRHVIAILLFISPSNLFLCEYLDVIGGLVVNGYRDHIASFIELLRPAHQVEKASWLFDGFVDFFDDNADYLDFNESFFFLHGINPKAFPLTAFLEKFLLVTSKVEKATKRTFKIEGGPFVYLMIQSPSDKDVFAIRADGADVSLNSGTPIILHHNSIEVAMGGAMNVTVQWCSVDPGSLLDRIHECFSNWKLNYSHQLVLGGEIDPISYRNFPMSGLVDFDFAYFASLLLRDSELKFIKNHTLRYSFDLKGKEVQTDPEVAEICAQIGTARPLPHTIDFSIWAEICNHGSRRNQIFRGTSGLTSEISPVFLRWKCSGASAKGLQSFVIFAAFEQSFEARLANFVRNAPEQILLYFVEWVTGEWGVDALGQSECPFIVILQSGGEGEVQVHQKANTLEIGRFPSPDEMMLAVMSQWQTFLDLQYN
jgi:hypothetical protein